MSPPIPSAWHAAFDAGSPGLRQARLRHREAPARCRRASSRTISTSNREPARVRCARSCSPRATGGNAVERSSRLEDGSSVGTGSRRWFSSFGTAYPRARPGSRCGQRSVRAASACCATPRSDRNARRGTRALQETSRQSPWHTEYGCALIGRRSVRLAQQPVEQWPRLGVVELRPLRCRE